MCVCFRAVIGKRVHTLSWSRISNLDRRSGELVFCLLCSCSCPRAGDASMMFWIDEVMKSNALLLCGIPPLHSDSSIDGNSDHEMSDQYTLCLLYMCS